MRDGWLKRCSDEVLKRPNVKPLQRFNPLTLQRSLRLGVAGEMHFRALRQQTLATALTPPRERGASAFRAHARAKAVLLFAGALRALKCPFHP